MRSIFRSTVVAVLAAAVSLAATQASAVTPATPATAPSTGTATDTATDTATVVERALAARGADRLGPERPAVAVRHDAKSVTVATDGISHSVTAVDRRNSEVRRLPDGGQVLSVLRSGSSTRFGLTLHPGWRLQPAAGGYLITRPGSDLVGVIEAPWAIDADGRSLPTWYQTDGRQLVQHVDPAGARYPLTLDPKLTYGRGIYLNLWGYEAQAAVSALIAIGGGAAYITCQGLSRLPSGIKKVLDVVCKVSGAAAAVTIRNILETLKGITGIRAYDCYQKRIVPNQGGWRTVKAKNCA